MAETCTYRSEKRLEGTEIARLDQRLSKDLKGYQGFEKGASQDVFFDGIQQLPELPALSGASLGRTQISGNLTGDPWSAFRDVLNRGSQLFPQENVEVRVGFEERGSHQTARAYDTLAPAILEGEPFFRYGANGSRVAKEPEYARPFLSDVIGLLNLPLELRTEGDEYYLHHTGGGTLYLPKSGSRKQNPIAFHCELQGAAPGYLVELMQRFLDRFASDKRFEQSWQVWTASNAPWDPLPEAEGLYREVRKAGFAADTYELQLTLFIDDLQGLDVWKGLVSGDTHVFTELGAVELSKTNWLKTSVLTTAEGHCLEVETRVEMKPSEIEQILGVKVEKVVN